jgi:hypothetical protein
MGRMSLIATLLLHTEPPSPLCDGAAFLCESALAVKKGAGNRLSDETAMNLALEAVHQDWRRTNALDFRTCVARCPDGISREAHGSKELPAGWNACPAPRSAAEFGDASVGAGYERINSPYSKQRVALYARVPPTRPAL